MAMSRTIQALRAFSVSALLIAATAVCAETTDLAQETAAKIEQIRAIKARQSTQAIAKYNEQLNADWQFYAAHKPAILPILRGLLGTEIAREHPSDLVLLDLGLFVHGNDAAEGKALARDALFRLDPRATLIDENRKELFELTHAAAEDRDPRVLDLIDRSFLPSMQKFFIPQHALDLDGALACVFLYGAYGADAESHLSAKLKDPSVAKRILELLVWLGSPDSVRPAADALAASPTYDTLTRVTAYMMQAAGPAGRDFMLKVDPDKLDRQSREYLAKIRPAIQAMSFDGVRTSLAEFPGDKKLPDPEVKSRLDAMIANFGRDTRTSPLAILDSGIASDVLISTLLKVRTATMYRISDEALGDAEITNTAINGLRYRGH